MSVVGSINQSKSCWACGSLPRGFTVGGYHRSLPWELNMGVYCGSLPWEGLDRIRSITIDCGGEHYLPLVALGNH